MKKQALLFTIPIFIFTAALRDGHPEIQTELPVSNGDSSFAVAWETQNTAFGADDKYIYLYTELRGGKANENPNRKPLNISLVVDRSGSMSGNKILFAQQAAKTLVQNLHKGDHFALVDYDDVISVPVYSTTIADNKEDIKSHIDKLTPRGSTNLCGGMLEGFKQAKIHNNPQFLNRVILLSDGLANSGISSNEEIQKIARAQYEETGITLSSFGIGADFNETLMTHLAEYGNGNYYFINNAEEITTQLASELQGLMNTVAQNIEMRIKLPKSLELEKVYGGTFTKDNDEILIKAGTVIAEETKPVLIKMRISNMAAQAFEFGAKISFLESNTKEQKTFEKSFSMHFNQNKEELEKTKNVVVYNAIKSYELNDIMETAMSKMEGGDQAGAKVLLDTIYSATYAGFVKDTLRFTTNTTVVKTFHLQSANNQTFATKSSYDQKVMLKQGRADNYKMRAKTTTVNKKK